MFQTKSKGFTLVEILVVMAILGVLATLALPSFLRSKVNSNESVAKSSMRTYSTALENYRSAQNPPAYPPDLNTLVTSTPPYLDTVMGSGTHRGYRFTYTFVSVTRYTITATPQIPNVTGINTYFVDESGGIRLNNANGQAIE